MCFAIVWIDKENAKIFQISSEKMERQHIRASHNDHHTHQKDQFDAERIEKKIFSDVVPNISSAEKILILGPGVAKHHLQTYLMEHFPALAKKVLAVETVDHPTDAQIVAFTRKFFVKAS